MVNKAFPNFYCSSICIHIWLSSTFLVKYLNKFYLGKKFAYQYIPFYFIREELKGLKLNQIINIERLITFDALTPAYDSPISNKDFLNTIVEAGFDILYESSNNRSQWCTAIKK